MSKILSILQIVNETVNDFTLKSKRNFTEPKIYTGGIEITKWSKYSKAEQQEALEKNWFVYFSFRNPKTGFLEKQPFIKGGVNRYKTKEERIEILETYRRNLLRILKEGYNPYDEKGTQNEIKSVASITIWIFCPELKILRVFLRMSLMKFSAVFFLGVFILFQS